MEGIASTLPRRLRPVGVVGGSPLTRIATPADAFALVGDDMAAAESQLARLLGSDVRQVSAVGSYLAEAGGKRLRPLLTALGCRAAGLGGDIARLMCVGELIHLGSLLHDDVVDDADERRGKPAAHLVHGNACTILSGDFCLARAILLASEEGSHAAVTELARAVTAMAEGEVLQLVHAGDLSTTRAAWLETVDKKSAALIAWCAAVGAWVSEQEPLAAHMEAFGRKVGVAFQVTDDVLDYGGDARVTGKLVGADLRERKITLPLLHAFERVEGLRERLEAGPPSDGELPELVGLVRDSGALEASLADARRWTEAGIEALATLPDSLHKDALIRLAWYLVERVR